MTNVAELKMLHVNILPPSAAGPTPSGPSAGPNGPCPACGKNPAIEQVKKRATKVARGINDILNDGKMCEPN